MDAERWKQVDSLLQSALLVSSDQRDEFVRRECAGDAALEQEVRSLLTSLRNADDFLEGPAIRVAAKAMAQADTGDGVDSMCGRVISHYRILKKLGRGGMGEVYRARDIRLNREVAIKTLSLDGGSQPDAISRFEQEARAACGLNHPNIVTIYELGQVDGTPYIAMELVIGETVRELLDLWPDSIPQSRRNRSPDCRRSRQSARDRNRSSRSEAGEFDGFRRDTAKILDFGLAKLLATKPCPGFRCFDELYHGGRNSDGHGGLHVPGTGYRRRS